MVTILIQEVENGYLISDQAGGPIGLKAYVADTIDGAIHRIEALLVAGEKEKPDAW